MGLGFSQVPWYASPTSRGELATWTYTTAGRKRLSSSSSSVLHGNALQHTKVRCVTRSVQRQSVQSTQSRSSALGRAVPTSMKPQVGQHSNYSGMLIHPQSRCFRTLLLRATGATEQSLQETILCAWPEDAGKLVASGAGNAFSGMLGGKKGGLLL